MVASLLLLALKGAHAEVLDEQGIIDRLKKVGQLTAVFAGELNAAVGLAPYGVRSLRVRSSIAVAGTPAAAAAAAPFGVVLFPSIPYGPKPRHLLDIYVPADVYQQLPQQQQPRRLQQQQPQRHWQQQRQQHCKDQAKAPVVFFCHGGIWATGDRWHFGPMATRLAQEGVIVVVISYTLYPEVLAGEMAGEVLGALLYTLNNIFRYGGDNNNITVLGHSAGGHLGALALMMMVQHRCQQQQQQWSRQATSNKSTVRSSTSSRSSSSNTETQQQQQPIDYLSLPSPKVFLGMSGVYDIALHFAFESQRGVAGISTMARVCGGAALFDAVSPAVLLKQAAAAGHHQLAGALPGQQELLLTQVQQQDWHQQQQVQWPGRVPQAAAAEGFRFVPADQGGPVHGDYAAAAAATRRSVAAAELSAGLAAGSASLQSAQQQQQQQQSGPQLLGEIIPYRCGMIASDGRHQQPCSRRQSGLSITAAAGPLAHSSSSSGQTSNTAAAAGVFDDATVVLAKFSVDAAKHLPPFVIMNSCADHMVPWHEGSDMLQALLTCDIPAKQLIYDRHLHNDFVLDWKPLVVAGASGSSNGVAAAAAASHVGARPGDSMPAFARDLISIVTGQVKLQFGSTSNARAAVSPLEGRSTMPAAAAAATSLAVPDISSKDDSIHLRGPWFALPRSRL